MRNALADKALLLPLEERSLGDTLLLTLLIVGTNMAKSEPSWLTKEHKVSITAIRNSLGEPSKTRTRGCIMREA